MDRSESEALTASSALGRRQFLRGAAAAGAVVGAGSLLAACSGSSSTSSTGATASGSVAATGKPRVGGDLKVGLTGGGPTDTLDPNKGLTYLDSARLSSLYNPLVQLDVNGRDLQWMLATGITAVAGSNFTKWEIHLRPGVTFHDGKPFTADDVIFTLKRIVNGHLNGTLALGPIDLNNTKATDPHTVLATFKSPYSSFVTQLAAAGVYLFIAPTNWNAKKPVGTGPFMYKSFTSGTSSLFTRNPNYWNNGKPYADTLEVIDFQDATSLADSLQTGVVHAAGTLNGTQMATLGSVGGVKTVPSPSGGIVPFTMRLDQAPFNDVRVRQALRLLVDRAQFIDSALDGYGTLAYDVFSPFDPDFNKSLVRHTDIDQAKHLLKQAGKADLTVTLTTSPITTGATAMATVLAEQAKAAGVTINLKNVDSGTFFGKNYLSWTFAQDYYNYFPYLTMVGQSMLGETSPFHETHNDNEQYAKWYYEANKADPASSLEKELLYEMQNYDFTQGGYIIPAFVDTLDAYSTKISGFVPAPIGQPLSNFGMENWYFV